MKKLIFILTYLLFVIPCQGRTTFVDANTPDNNDGSSWSNAYRFLQDALAEANTDPNINVTLVAQGTYKPDCNSANPNGTGDREATFQLINGVIIKGGYAGNGKPDPNARNVEQYETILSGDLDDNDDGFTNNGENSIHVVTGISTGVKATIEGFTICNGNANVGDHYDHRTRGGGVYISSGENIVTDCTVRNNAAREFGGAIYMSSSAGISSHILHCRIFDNRVSIGRGGGIYATYGIPTIKKCIINKNYSSWYGGGIYLHSSNAEISHCEILGNSADSHGGGIISFFGKPTISNSLITRNSSGDSGGGILLGHSSATILNSTIVKNHANTRGGGLFINYSYPKVTNSILWLNSAPTGQEIYILGGGSATASYCNIRGGWPGTGNINKNPSFVSESTNDYHLLPYSPCIDAGDPCYIPEPNETDLDGQPRIIGGRVDIGADEFHGNNSRPVADAGEDQIAYAWFDWLAEVILDGNGSYDDDGHVLTYLWRWSIDVNNFTAISPSPSIKLPTGEHVVELVVNDRVEDSEPDDVMITVVPPVQAGMRFTPQALNPSSKGRWVKAHLVLPEGFVVEDVNTNSPARIVEPFMADSNFMDVFLNEDDLVKIMAAFDRAVFCSNGSMLEDIVVIAQLTTGQYFYGTDTIRIKTNNLKYLAVLTSYWLAGDCGEPDWCAGADLNRNSVVDFIDFAFFDGCCLEFIQN